MKRKRIIIADSYLTCAHSNFIITNHSMLLADINRRQPLFSSLAGLIVDEAHQFVQTAISS